MGGPCSDPTPRVLRAAERPVLNTPLTPPPLSTRQHPASWVPQRKLTSHKCSVGCNPGLSSLLGKSNVGGGCCWNVCGWDPVSQLRQQALLGQGDLESPAPSCAREWNVLLWVLKKTQPGRWGSAGSRGNSGGTPATRLPLFPWRLSPLH